MKISLCIATWQRLRQQPNWKLLAAVNAPLIAGWLQALLLDGERQLPALLMHERLARELDDLHAHGQVAPRTPQAYVADWLAAGWRERRFPAAASEGSYDLTASAIAALRFLDSSRSVATESRLALVIQQLVQLARQTDADPNSRLAELLAERERIDAQIAAVSEGRVNVLDETRALERAREVIALADDFQQLDRDFRERILDEERQRGEMLEALFAGVDLIVESEAGRSFDAFWRLLIRCRAERSAESGGRCRHQPRVRAQARPPRACLSAAPDAHPARPRRPCARRAATFRA